MVHLTYIATKFGTVLHLAAELILTGGSHAKLRKEGLQGAKIISPITIKPFDIQLSNWHDDIRFINNNKSRSVRVLNFLQSIYLKVEETEVHRATAVEFGVNNGSGLYLQFNNIVKPIAQ